MTRPPDQHTDDVWDNPIGKEWRERMNRDLRPMIEDSAISITIAPGDKPDAKVAVELGFTILLDKPILILAPRGRHVPERLRRVADAVIFGEPSEPKVRAQIMAFLAEHGIDKEGGDE